MKKIKSSIAFSLVFVLLLSVSFMSCKKTKTGPVGEKGDTGNANVKAVVFTTTCHWKADSTGKRFVFEFYIEII
jgi:hypothetical protein